MDRRGLLAGVALAACGGCLTDPPAATGPRNPPDEPIRTTESGSSATVRVADLDIEEADDGRLRVLAVVANDGDVDATRTLTLTVTVGDDERVRTRDVRAPAGGETEVSVTFEVAYDAFTGEGNLSADLD